MLVLRTDGDFVIPVILCDECQAAIEKAGDMVAITTTADQPIRMAHKECKMKIYQRERFMDVNYLMSRLVNDMGFDITVGKHITDMNKGI